MWREGAGGDSRWPLAGGGRGRGCSAASSAERLRRGENTMVGGRTRRQLLLAGCKAAAGLPLLLGDGALSICCCGGGCCWRRTLRGGAQQAAAAAAAAGCWRRLEDEVRRLAQRQEGAAWPQLPTARQAGAGGGACQLRASGAAAAAAAASGARAAPRPAPRCR